MLNKNSEEGDNDERTKKKLFAILAVRLRITSLGKPSNTMVISYAVFFQFIITSNICHKRVAKGELLCVKNFVFRKKLCKNTKLF